MASLSVHITYYVLSTKKYPCTKCFDVSVLLLNIIVIAFESVYGIWC